MKYLQNNSGYWLILFSLLLLLLRSAASPAATVAIIVANDNGWKGLEGSVNRRTIMRIYRKQVTLDKRGNRLHPVNLPATHPLRKKFSLMLFNRTPLQMTSFWNERYFQGISPPHVVNSQEAMIRFVSKTPGAIGYVASCALDERVKVLLTLTIEKQIHARICAGK